MAREHVHHGGRLAQHLGTSACCSSTTFLLVSSTARRISSTALGRSKGLGGYSNAPLWKAEGDRAVERSE